MHSVQVHWLDRVFRWLQPQGSLFRLGWGPSGTAEELRSLVSIRREPSAVTPILERRGTRHGATLYEGWFPSPASELPREAQRARVRILLPRGPVRGVCIHLGGMGEPGWFRRQRLAAPLLSEGIGAALLEYPYYGSRRPLGQRGFALGLFADQLRLSLAAVAETASLVGWLRREGHEPVVAGFSMGACVAAYVAVAVPWPLAVVLAGAGSSHADLMTRSQLSHMVHWPALGEEQAAKQRLAALLDTIALHELPAPIDARCAQLIGFRHDGVVDPEQVRALHDHWPGSRLRWLDTGHMGGFFFGAEAIRSAIRDALPRSE